MGRDLTQINFSGIAPNQQWIEHYSNAHVMA